MKKNMIASAVALCAIAVCMMTAAALSAGGVTARAEGARVEERAVSVTTTPAESARRARFPMRGVMAVVGEGEATAKADVCVIVGSVTCVGATAEEAAEALDDALEKLRGVTSGLTASGASVFPACGVGHTATASVQVRTYDVGGAEELRGELMSAGMSGYVGMTYEVADDGTVRAEALRDAVEDATRKAEALGYDKLLAVKESHAYAVSEADGAGGIIVRYAASVRAVFADTPDDEEK